MSDTENRKPLDYYYPPERAVVRVQFASDEFGSALQREMEETLAQRQQIGARRHFAANSSRSRPYYYGSR